MGTKSDRAKMVIVLRALHVRRFVMRLMRIKRRERNVVMDVVDLMIEKKLLELESNRYIRRKKYRTRAFNMYRLDKDSPEVIVPNSNPHLNSHEFNVKYRMSRENFMKLLKLIKNHPVFGGEKPKVKKMATVEEQLMTFLAFIGHEGGNGHLSRSLYSIGYGTHYLYCDRVAEAICSLRKSAVFWPDTEEREEIASRMKKKFDFPNCVGMGDGTLFPLQFSPSTDDACDYSGRKYKYSITCFIINDDERRIRAYMAGWPGSVHDNRVFGNMRMNRYPLDHFSHSQYILSDSALENCEFVVAAFKKPPLNPMPREHERFNTKLATARISAEHTIGILKGRFRWLKHIRMKISKDKSRMVRILKYIDCCVIIHNLMINLGDDIDLVDEWLDDDDVSDVDDCSRVPSSYDMLHRPVKKGSSKDERRKRLQRYFEFKEYL